MVVDGEVGITFNVLAVIVAFVLVDPDADTLPSRQLFGTIAELHQLFIGDALTDYQARFTEWRERCLALLPGLFGVQFLSSMHKWHDALPAGYGGILEHGAVEVCPAWVDV